MNVYLIGILISFVVYLIVGTFVGRKVKNAEDYYVAGRRAPVILIVGSLTASFMSTGAFMGDVGEVYNGFFMAIVMVGIIQATGYIYGGFMFGRYLRRSEALTIPEYFARRFDSKKLRMLIGICVIVAVGAYLLSVMQGMATLMTSITPLPYWGCILLAWAAFTFFTVFSGSPGVLITDTIMFMVFVIAAIIAFPFITGEAGGWSTAIESLATFDPTPGIISWAGNPDYMYPSGGMNTLWATTYGIVWIITISVSPWQSSRYMMAKNEHTVLRSAIFASMCVIGVQTFLYFAAAFVAKINPDLGASNAPQAMIWAAQHAMPAIVGIILLTGIVAAGISSASTFLSLIGFSVVNDIMQFDKSDTKKTLSVSRRTMFIASLVILVLAIFNPPQIFWIMYFGSTVIACSLGIVSFASVWSKRITKTGAFCGVLMGFLGCGITKIVASVTGTSLPFYFDPFIVGFVLSAIGVIVGSKLTQPTAIEVAEREKLFVVPTIEKSVKEWRLTSKMSWIYFAFAAFILVFFIFGYAVPYVNGYLA